jgi:hypothetical protein
MKKRKYEQTQLWFNVVWLNLLNFFNICIPFFQKVFLFIEANVREFGIKYPNLSQSIQVTFLYYFAFVDLVYSIVSVVLSLGPLPEILKPFYPTFEAILKSPFLQFWASPEKTFILSYGAIEFMVVRSTFRFSKLVRYNILLIFALLMLQGLVLSYWDLFFHRQIADPTVWEDDEDDFSMQIIVTMIVFTVTFLFFFFLYLWLYLTALRGKMFRFKSKYLAWITDSVFFWLKIKTSTMPFKFRKKKK